MRTLLWMQRPAVPSTPKMRSCLAARARVRLDISDAMTDLAPRSFDAARVLSECIVTPCSSRALCMSFVACAKSRHARSLPPTR
eukprot:1881900-Pyramimonas_sp.AAC.1